MCRQADQEYTGCRRVRAQGCVKNGQSWSGSREGKGRAGGPLLRPGALQMGELTTNWIMSDLALV